MAYGIAPDPKLYDELWSYINWLNGGNVFLNRNGEGFSSKYPDPATVAGYCARGGIYVDYCGWPMYYDHQGGNANGDRFKQFLSYVGQDPNYCRGFIPYAWVVPCYPMPGKFIRAWVTGANAYIPPPSGGGRLAASYEAPSNYCQVGSEKYYAYTAVGVKVYSGGVFKGWYFYGAVDGPNYVSPQVYARFIKECVKLYPPPGGGGGDNPETGCEPDKCTSEPLLCRACSGGQNSGPCVGWVQRRLKQLGYAPGPTDCIFGVRTEAAVKQFQKDRGLVVDGIVGPKTWAALKSGGGGGGGGGEGEIERCIKAGCTWDYSQQLCICRTTPERDWLIYLLIGGAAAGVGLGIYFLVRR